MKVLVTGSAGFIGMHAAERLLARGDQVIGIDNLSDYYAVTLKEARLARLSGGRAGGGFRFQRLDIAAPGALETLFAAEKPDAGVHQAGQAVEEAQVGGVGGGRQHSHVDALGRGDAEVSGFVARNGSGLGPPALGGAVSGSGGWDRCGGWADGGVVRENAHHLRLPEPWVGSVC